VSGDDSSRVFSIGTGNGSVTISGLRLTDGLESAISSSSTDLMVASSVVSGSQGTEAGGIFAVYGSLTVRDSTVSGNTADVVGGVEAFGADLTLENSTVSGNTAVSAGVYVSASLLYPASVTVRNSTIAGNTVLPGGGALSAAEASVDLRGALLADNGGDDLRALSQASFAGSFNLIEDPGNVGPFGTNNILGVDPNLKPLKNNGGPTDTHAFKKSPAKNKIPKGQTPKADQRGAKRKGKGDIGAYELVKCEGVIVNRVGTAKKDKLKGTKRKDGILGLGGNDKLQGKKGKDGLCGGKGKDTLKGGPGKDKLDGGPGKDREIQ
jgi:hypothetical protein